MNKKLIVIISVVAVLGLLGFLVYSKVIKPKSGGTSENVSPTSLKDMLLKGVAQTCTYNNEGNSGTVYVSNGKMRGDFETKVEDKVTKSHIIVDGNTSYMWNDEQKVGYKIVAEKTEGEDTSVKAPETGSINLGENLNYSCKPWIVNGSLYDLPAGVNFMSFGEALNPTGAKSAQCAVCESLTGEEKTQCLTSLKCN